MRRWTRITGAALLLVAALAGCTREADVASHNLSYEADQFRIDRRIVFINGITDNYMMTIEGRCSITDEGYQLEVTCKVSETEYKKHFLGLSDNVTYFVEQLEAAQVGVYRYAVNFRPSVIVPDIETETP